MNAIEDYQGILDFWFGRSESLAVILDKQASLWWGKDPHVDREIRERFVDRLDSLIDGKLNEWRSLPESYLAMIILADQFSRNIYRDSASAFAQDELALSLTLDGIENGIDLKLNVVQRVFFYLPFEHSESMAIQDRSVELQKQVLDDAPDNLQDQFQGFYNYALLHREVIEKYGRYPHRNNLLGRECTPEEIDYLNQPGSGF